MDYVLADDAAQNHPLAEVRLDGSELKAFCTVDGSECINKFAQEQLVPVSKKGTEGRVHKICRPFSESCESCLRNPSRKE